MRRKFLIVSLLIVVLISFLTVTVSADKDYSFTVTMTSNNTTVSAGGEVLITVKVSNLNVGENGISSFQAYLSYDTDVFEQLTESSIDGIDGWKPSYTVGTTKVQLYREKPLKVDGEVMQITLKTKQGLEDGTSGEVKLSTIIVSDSIDTVIASPVSTTITIGSGGSGSVVKPPVTNSAPSNVSPLNITFPTNNSIQRPGNIAPLNTTPIANNTVNNTSNITNTIQNEIEVVNESDGDIPYTGSDSNALIKIIIGVIFIGLVMYIKIERMNKDIK